MFGVVPRSFLIIFLSVVVVACVDLERTSTDDESVPDFLKSQKNLPIVTDSDYQVLPDISNKLINKKTKRV